MANKRSLLTSEHVDVVINNEISSNCMQFVFKGKFTKEASALATQAWITEFQANPGIKYSHLWDCIDMKNFDFKAQDDWMNTLSSYSKQIEYIAIVSDSLLMRGAARAMSAFTKLDLRVYKSYDEMNAS